MKSSFFKWQRYFLYLNKEGTDRGATHRNGGNGAPSSATERRRTWWGIYVRCPYLEWKDYRCNRLRRYLRWGCSFSLIWFLSNLIPPWRILDKVLTAEDLKVFWGFLDDLGVGGATLGHHLGEGSVDLVLIRFIISSDHMVEDLVLVEELVLVWCRIHNYL